MEIACAVSGKICAACQRRRSENAVIEIRAKVYYNDKMAQGGFLLRREFRTPIKRGSDIAYAVAHIKKGGARALKAGGMWIYDNEIASVTGEYKDGDVVAVEDFDGYFLGYGFLNSHSKIRIRILSRRREHEITEAFLEQRIRDLNVLYRETREIALVLERYYDRRYHNNERYTL